MMFQGSKHVPEDQLVALLKKAGATGINGTTNTDRTNYFALVPAHQLETALWLESLDNQREVVRNERFWKTPADHYEALSKKLGAVDARAIKALAGKHLAPEALGLLVVGDPAVLPKLEALARARPELAGAKVVALTPDGARAAP